MRAFYDRLSQIDRIFSSKVIILPNNRKKYLEIQRRLTFRCQWYKYQTFKLFDLNKDFSKLTERTSIISVSEKITSPRFHAVSFVCK